MLANFIIEFTYPYKEEESPMETWAVQVDRSATRKVGGVGVVLISPEKRNTAEVSRCLRSRTDSYARKSAGQARARATLSSNSNYRAIGTRDRRLRKQASHDLRYSQHHTMHLVQVSADVNKYNAT